VFCGDLQESRVVHHGDEFVMGLRYGGGVYAATVDSASGAWKSLDLWSVHPASSIGLATSEAGTILAVAGRTNNGPTPGIAFTDLDADRGLRVLTPIVGAMADPLTVVDVASNGTNHLVVWEQWTPVGIDIYGCFIADGVAGPVFPISDSPVAAVHPAVAWNGSSYTVVWAAFDGTSRQLMATEVPGVGAPGAARKLTTGEPIKRNIAIAHDGTGLVLSWLEGDGSTGAAWLYKARMQPDGSLATPTRLDTLATERPSIAAGAAGHSAIVSVRYDTVEARVA
jgi:hypothetical protein